MFQIGGRVEWRSEVNIVFQQSPNFIYDFPKNTKCLEQQTVRIKPRTRVDCVIAFVKFKYTDW